MFFAFLEVNTADTAIVNNGRENGFGSNFLFIYSSSVDFGNLIKLELIDRC